MQNVQSFLKTIPAIVSGKDKLAALFCTYNDVWGFNRGSVDTGKKNLVIYVTADTKEAIAERDQFLLSAFASPFLLRRYDNMVERSQKEVEDCFLQDNASSFCESTNTMFVVYMGLTGFSKTCTFLEYLRREYPDAYIAGLTCDCNMEEKKERLNSLEKQGVLNTSIVTEVCGGSIDLADTIKFLIEVWPVVETKKD